MPNQPNDQRPTNFRWIARRTLKGISSSLAFAPAVLLSAPAQAVQATASTSPFETSFPLTGVLAGLAALLGVSTAVLYRHMHQRELDLSTRAKNAEAELRALLMMTNDAVLVLSTDGTVRATNPAAEELFEREAPDFFGEPLTEFVAQPLSLGELTRNGPVNFPTTVKAGNEYLQVQLTLSAVEISGRASYVAMIQTDQSTASALPDRDSQEPPLPKVVEKYTHDLNNQLTSVLGNLSLILMSSPGDPANQERALNAKKTALRAQSLSHQLQILAQKEDDKTTAFQFGKDFDRNIVLMPNVAPAKKITTPPASTSASRILILDDEADLCEIVATGLEAAGFDVFQATTVASAITACEEAKSAGQPFALMICDLTLPGDISGTQAAARIREIDPAIKSIVSSGSDSDPIMRDCRKFGFTAALVKPYELSSLVRAVGEVLAAQDNEIRKSA